MREWPRSTEGTTSFPLQNQPETSIGVKFINKMLIWIW